MSSQEALYRAKGLVKTIATEFWEEPSTADLHETFCRTHKGTNLSVGAKALCKHFARKEFVMKKHPFWLDPRGSEVQKSEDARRQLDDMLRRTVWRNIHRLNKHVVVYEIRNELGYGMRWNMTPGLEFRGFLEAHQRS
ncbi:hypothetical protein SpCBS45565_g03036 [Spizellomyces sp. 'palustris']|nr:hypothetical protein SpCBS45565_g03036 [Spizellomyces sp. 'palustris']